MSNVIVNFHWRDKAIGDEMPSAARLRKERQHIVVSLGEGPDSAVLSLFFASAASAYAFASTVMSGAEYLESVEQAAKDDPERPWIDIPLPLDEDQAPAAESLASLRGAWDDGGVRAAVRESVGDLVDDCLVGRPDQCAEIGCANESCPRY